MGEGKSEEVSEIKETAIRKDAPNEEATENKPPKKKPSGLCSGSCGATK